MFHWASSDLYEFWKTQKPDSSLCETNTRWILEQCYGIARGVHDIHEYQSRFTSGVNTLNSPNDSRRYGRHTDIKPQNFLVFRKGDNPGNYGTIQLTDFGLCEFRGEHSRSNIRQSALSGGTATYSPPEAYMEHGTISRSYDIWSLGCVYLEFITWHLGGWSYVLEFTGARMSRSPNGLETDQFCCFEQSSQGEYRPRVKQQVLDVSRRSDQSRSCCCYYA